AAEHDEMLGHAPVLVALERGHRDKIVGEQPVGFYQRAFGGVERGVAEPVAQAQQVLLDGGLFGNVRVFFEVTFEEVEVGFVRDRDVRHFVDPFACNRKYRPTSLTYPRRIYMSSNVHCNDDCREASHLMKILSIFIFLAYVSVLQSPRLFAAEAKPTASGDWEKTVEAAKKEGKVVVSVPASAELRKGLEKNFKQRFGIDAELNVGRSTSIVGNIQQEARSGVAEFGSHMGGGGLLVPGP